MNTRENIFKIKFDGQQHQIDANVLISSLIHTSTIIHETNRHLNSGKKIDVKIKALEPGSFVINIELLETTFGAIKDIFTKENLGVAGSIVTILTGAIALKKFLKGKKAKSIQEQESKTTITNHYGDSITIENIVYNVYNSENVNDAISQNFEAINNDPAITGFEITDEKNTPIVRVDKTDFEDMIFKSEEIQDDERILTEAATLNIVRLSFDEALKWEFYYKGNRISAKINDPSFQKLIDSGERFAKGDVLEVELQIKQKFDISVNTHINKSYSISKIIRHILREKPQEIKFEI